MRKEVKLTKIRKLAMICLVTLLVVYCGVTLFTSVSIAVNAKENMLLDLLSLSKKPATKPYPIIPLGDPINDPRPH